MRQLTNDISATAFLILITALALLTGSCNNSGGGGGSSKSGPANPVVLPKLALTRVFPNLTLSSPVAMLQAPNDDTRWFVVERGGTVKVFPNSNTVTDSNVSSFVSVSVNTSGEGGLLGIAFHPNFPSTPEIFLSYTRTGPDPVNFPLTTVISRFYSSDGGLTIDATPEEVLLTLDQPATNHNGGHIAFGLGGLYIGLGDGGGGNDPWGNGQNVNTLLGAMLRIDVDGTPETGKAYAIPADNPFYSGGGAREIFAWGLRNPWRFSFDRSDQRLWLGDVGQGAWEEVDIIELGKNYGWNVCEGAHLRGSTTQLCTYPAYTNPIAEYLSDPGCRSITGGYVYRGSAIANLYGIYLFGDFCVGTIWGLKENVGNPPTVEAVMDTGFNVVSFGEGVNGDLYVVNLGGTLHKIIAAP